MDTITSDRKVRCGYITYDSHAGRTCTRFIDPSEAMATEDWRGIVPLCRTHLAAMKRRKYDSRAIVPLASLWDRYLAQEPLASLWDRYLAQEAAKKKADAERRAAENAQREESAKRWTAIAQAETKEPATWRREDDPTPRWIGQRVGGERSAFSHFEVSLDDPYGEPRIRVRNASEMTPNEAKALIEMMQAALDVLAGK